MNVKAVAVAIGPSFGPAIVTLFGIDVPIVALGLSMVALIVARQIAAPNQTRKLTKRQEFFLTIVLVIILFLIVTGQLFYKEPLGPGWAVVWAIGLGMSGLLILELFADTIVGFTRSFLAAWRRGPPPPPPPPTGD